MHVLHKLSPLGAPIFLIILLSACTAEIGSEQWCANLKEKSKADWTTNEATDFAKHCIFK